MPTATLSRPARSRDPNRSVNRPIDLHAGALQLAEILGTLADRHGALRGLMERQRQALMQSHLTELEVINAEADQALAELDLLNFSRKDLTDRLALACKISALPKIPGKGPGSDVSEIKLEDLLPYLPDDAKFAVQTQRQRLKSNLPEMQRQWAINSALAANGSRIVHTTLSILTSVVGREGPDRHQVYGAKGKTHYARAQVRSLLNRSA